MTVLSSIAAVSPSFDSPSFAPKLSSEGTTGCSVQRAWSGAAKEERPCDVFGLQQERTRLALANVGLQGRQRGSLGLDTLHQDIEPFGGGQPRRVGILGCRA